MVFQFIIKATIMMTVVLSMSSHAAILYEQSSVSSLTLGFTSVYGTNEQDVADNFITTGNWNVASAGWAGVFDLDVVIEQTRDFTVEFYNDVNSSPDANPFVTMNVSAYSFYEGTNSSGDRNLYSFKANLLDTVNLLDSASYFFSVTDRGQDSSGSNGMFWRTTSSGDTDINIRSGDLGDWGVISGGAANTVFSLSDTTVVPIPAAVWLFSSGLLGVFGLARYNKKE
jgi:hypothetical protein